MQPQGMQAGQPMPGQAPMNPTIGDPDIAQAMAQINSKHKELFGGGQ